MIRYKQERAVPVYLPRNVMYYLWNVLLLPSRPEMVKYVKQLCRNYATTNNSPDLT